MAFVVNVKSYASQSTLTLQTVLGANNQNDLILVFATARDSSATLAISGYTGLDSQRAGYAFASRWFVKIAGVGGEAAPIVTTGGRPATVISAISYVIRDADVSGTAANAIDGIAYLNGSTGRTASSPSLTTGTDNCLLVHGAIWDATPILPDIAAVNSLAHSPVNFSANAQPCSGVAFKETAGAIPTFTYTATTTGAYATAWVLAIKNGASGEIPARMTDGRVVLQKLCGFDAVTTSAPDAVTGLTAINSINMNTAANTASGSVTWSTGQPPYYPWAFNGTYLTSNQNCTAAAWVGGFVANSATDISGKIVTLPYGLFSTVDSSSVGAEGFIVVFVDSADNWAAYQVLPQVSWKAYIAEQITIRLGTTTAYAVSASAIDFTDVVKVGYFSHRQSGKTTTVGIYLHLPVYESVPSVAIGGGANNPVKTSIEARCLLSGGLFPGQVSFQGAGQLVNKFGLQIGDGTNATYAVHTAQSYDIPAADDVAWRVGSGGVTLSIKASASDTIDLRSAIITSSILQPFTIDAASSLSASLLTTGLSVIGRTFSDLAGYDWLSTSWTECDTVAFKDGNVTTCTISSPNAAINGTTGAVCSFSANGSTVSGTTINCAKSAGGVAGYHLELGTAVTAITLTDVTFTGTPGTDKVHVLKASGTVTITISGTTSLVAGDVTSAGAMVVIAAPELYQSAAITGLAATYRIQLFDIEYDLTVSGITVTPTAGATYTHGGITWTVRSTSIVAGAGTMTVYGAGTPSASGTLTKASGTGDASVTFSAYVVDGTELYIGVPGATSYTWTDSVAAAAPRVIRLRVMEDGPGTADAILMIDAIIGVCGITEGTESVGYLVAAVADDVYNDRGVDGSTVTGITIDDSTLRLEIASGTIVNYNGTDVLVIDGRDIYAYETFWLGTTAGMRDQARFIEAVDAVNFRCSNFKLLGTSGYPIMIRNCYLVDAATGIFASLVDYSGDPISNAPDHMAAIVVSTSDSVVTGTLLEFIAAVPTANAIANQVVNGITFP